MSRTLRRLIPSPAMIVALVALAMSIGSSAYALGVITGQDIQDNSVTGTDIHERSLRGHDLRKNSVGRLAINESRLRSVRAKGLRFWAVVNNAGMVVRPNGQPGGGVLQAERESLGMYKVTFNRDVRSCSYQATIGGTGTAVPEEDSQITVSSYPDPHKQAVHVRTARARVQNGTIVSDRADMAFQLAVIC